MRKQLREWALKSYANAVDPANPDYLLWRGHGQAFGGCGIRGRKLSACLRPTLDAFG
jgi:hypothetical protein